MLAVLGAPMGASGFAALADLMAADFTVVTYDPRGSGRTRVTDRTRSTPHELLAEDVSRILSVVTDEPAAVLRAAAEAAAPGWRWSPRTPSRSGYSWCTSRRSSGC